MLLAVSVRMPVLHSATPFCQFLLLWELIQKTVIIWMLIIAMRLNWVLKRFPQSSLHGNKKDKQKAFQKKLDEHRNSGS
jgi:hypothetical protein